jgi:hypothetical protein
VQPATLGIVAILGGWFLLGERESKKGGDGAQLALEKFGKAKGRTLVFWLWTPVHERPALANRHSTNLRRLGKHVPLSLESSRGQPGK